jgi:hypothetical protein
MERDSYKTLAIVDSPLQVMMAFEYIKEFNVSDVHFVVSVHSIDFLKHNKSVLRYLNDIGAKYRIIVTKNLVYSLRYITSPKEYSRFIIGDFRSLDKKILTLFHAKGKVDIVYVDDGNASLELETGHTKTKGLKAFISLVVDKMINWRTKEKVYYSAFINQSEINGIRIISNQLKSMDVKHKAISDEIIVIGCFTGGFANVGANYYDYLHKLDDYIRVKWGKKTIVKYYPHRREDDIEGIKTLCATMGWQVCFSRINIEMELVNGDKTPKAIVGFGSSALFLLKKIFNNADIYSIHFTDSEDFLNVERIYAENGISVVNL